MKRRGYLIADIFFFFFNLRRQKQEAWKSWMSAEMISAQPCTGTARGGREEHGALLLRPA